MTRQRKSTTSLVLALVIVISLIINTGFAAAAPIADVSEECPASLIVLSEDLWKHVPELPDRNWNPEVLANAKLLWKSFLMLLGSQFPGMSSVLPNLPDLNWLPNSWFNDDSPDAVPVINTVSGAIVGFVPVVGDLVDGLAIITGQDQITGECLTRLNQSLLALGIGAGILFLPLRPVRGILKSVGKPLIKVLSDLPKPNPRIVFQAYEEIDGEIVRIITRATKLNKVADAFSGMRRIVGEGAYSTADLLRKFKDEGFAIEEFSNTNYRKNLMKFTGVDEAAARGLEAHHILPQEFEEQFLESGIENINDPRLLAWVEEGVHKDFNFEYSKAWKSFFEGKPSPSVEDVLEEARKLAEEYGYDVLFETSVSRLPGWLPWPFR